MKENGDSTGSREGWLQAGMAAGRDGCREGWLQGGMAAGNIAVPTAAPHAHRGRGGAAYD